MPRISTELPQELILREMAKLQAASPDGVATDVLMQSIIATFWDFDATDFRNGGASLFAQEWMILRQGRTLLLTPTGMEEAAKLMKATKP